MENVENNQCTTGDHKLKFKISLKNAIQYWSVDYKSLI